MKSLIAAAVALPLLIVLIAIPMMGGDEDKEDCLPTPVPPGQGIEGQVLIANANIKVRSGFAPGMAALTAPGPDFITLNEVGDVPASQLKTPAPGYKAFREPKMDRSRDAGRRSMDNAIAYRNDTWKFTVGGREKIVTRDHAMYRGEKKLWGKWAAWAVFERKSDGSRVSVISVHHMTNPVRFPRQWGNPPMTRKQQYKLGMERLRGLVADLSGYGPVLVGGDMNSHPNAPGDGLAVKGMAQAGYEYTNEEVIYNFHAAPATVMKRWSIGPGAVHSDHPALFTRLRMDAAKSSAVSTGTGTGTVAPAAAGAPTWPSDVKPGSDGAIRATYQLLLAVGFNESDAHLMTVVAGGESGWDTSALNPSSSATGLFQILQSHDWTADMLDPVVNARWAKRLFDADGNPNQWQAWPDSSLAQPPHVTGEQRQQIIETFNANSQRVEKVLGESPTPPEGDCPGGPDGEDPPGGVSGPLLDRLRQRGDMVIALAKKYPGGPCDVPGYDCQGVGFSGWGSACTAISMMIYGQNYVGSGDGGERAYGSEVQGRQGDTWPPPPGAIVSWPYSGYGHVSIYLGNGDWVDNWPEVAHQDHSQVENGAKAHWLVPPAEWEGDFLNEGLPQTTEGQR